MRTAFDALYPGTNPEASVGIAYRGPRARYPREPQGRWYDDRRACTDPRRDDRVYDTFNAMLIATETRSRRVGEERINAIRLLGRGSWAIDDNSLSERDVESFSTAIYTLTGDGVAITAYGHRTEWIRCR